MDRLMKRSLFLLTALLLSASGGSATAATIDTPVQTSSVQTWTEQEMLDGLESVWWYPEEASLMLFDQGDFYYVDFREVSTYSDALDVLQEPRLHYSIEEFFPDEGKLAVDRTTPTGFDEEYTLSPDGKTMEIHFPELGETFTYIYAGEAEDMTEILMDKMSGGGVVEVRE